MIYIIIMRKKARPLDEQIRKVIKEQGITGYRLAKNSGVSQSIIVRFLNGERNITLKTASKLTDALGLELKSKERGK